jgi:polyphosphate kinase
MYCTSADWMERNFFRRVEIAFPIQRDTHRARILRDLDFCLRDNAQTWLLQPDGSYQHINKRAADRLFSAQAELVAVYAAGPGPSFPS